MNKFTLLIFVSVFATLLTPKPAQAQYQGAQTAAQRAFEIQQFCMRNPNACYGAATAAGNRFQNHMGEQQRRQQEMRQRQQQDYNQGRFQKAKPSYGGW